ncbi:MAG: hypothetical protein K8J31_11685 [Anaerolineae bacterium]|nr:hypothetical protein [Anaerolineae bacterium]
MSELYDQIAGQRGSVERLIARLPGFGGYMERASRRTADRMLRDYVTAQIAERINRFVGIEKSLLESGGLKYMSKTKSAKTKLQTYQDRVKAAAPGYSGFFAAVKIGEEELERLYSFDEAQIRYVDRLDEALHTLEEAVKTQSDIDVALAAVDSLAVEANEAFKLRDDVLTNLDKSL